MITTYEEAKLCPKCGQTGEVRKIEPARGMRPGTKVHTVYCVTELCRWFNTPWMIQVNPDGTIPPPQDHTHSPKVYEGFEGHDDLADKIKLAIKLTAEAETKPENREIRNPRSGS